MSVIPFTSITNRTSKSILVCFHWSIEIFLAIISTLNYSPASFPIKYTLCPLWFQPFGWLKIKFLFYRLKFCFYKRTLIWKKPFSDFLHPLLIFFMKIWWQETGKLSTGRFLGFCGLLKTCFTFDIWFRDNLVIFLDRILYLSCVCSAEHMLKPRDSSKAATYLTSFSKVHSL